MQQHAQSVQYKQSFYGQNKTLNLTSLSCLTISWQHKRCIEVEAFISFNNNFNLEVMKAIVLLCICIRNLIPAFVISPALCLPVGLSCERHLLTSGGGICPSTFFKILS